MGSELPSDRVAIITVHGTGDTGGDEGEKWFQRGSAFTKRLLERLRSHGVNAEVVPHHWSGANSVRSRERSAERLAKLLRSNAHKYASVHVVGHSHGGNVANDAACMVGWPDGGARRKLSSITTVGTPFFRGAVSRWGWFGAIAFFILTIVTAIGLPVAIAGIVDQYGQHSASDAHRRALAVAEDDLRDSGAVVTEAAINQRAAQLEPRIRADFESRQQYLQRLTILGGASGVALFYVLPLAWQGARRVRRLRAKPRDDVSIYAIWHENDEAIAFLRQTEHLKFEAFPRGALWRASRTTAVVWGARIVLTVVAASVLIYVLGRLGIHPAAGVAPGLGGAFDDVVRYVQQIELDKAGVQLTQLGIALAPVVFLVTYWLTRLLAGIAPEWLARDVVNRRIREIVRSVAFGRDGDERIGQVSVRSHSFGTKVGDLPAEVIERMRTNAAAGADDFLKRYRWEMFGVTTDTTSLLERIQADEKTWNSLIHTTYFDQPEVADLIADYIASEAREASRSEPAKSRAPTNRGSAAAAGLPGAA